MERINTNHQKELVWQSKEAAITLGTHKNRKRTALNHYNLPPQAFCTSAIRLNRDRDHACSLLNHAAFSLLDFQPLDITKICKPRLCTGSPRCIL